LRAERLRDWRKRVSEFTSAADAEARQKMGEGLEADFYASFKDANAVTPGLHSAFVAWVHAYQIRVHNARAMMADTRNVSSRSERTANVAKEFPESSWPDICCVNSPVEADDQLGYLYRCGLVDVVFATDSDLVAMGCYSMVSRGFLNVNRSVKPKGFTEESIFARVREIFDIQSSQWRSIKDKREFDLCALYFAYCHALLAMTTSMACLGRLLQ